MKGFFNKVKDQVKGVMKTIENEINNSNSTSDQTDPNDLQRRNSAAEKKFKPRTRTEVAKEYIDSDRFFKLFQQLEEDLNEKDDPNGKDKTQFSLFSKERPTSISSIFYEKVKNSEKIDLGSQEIFNLITSSQEPALKDNRPLLLISVIGFHHKKGTVLDYSYPDLHNELGLNKELADFIEQSLLTAGMPDAVHNASEDFVYFIVNLSKRQLEHIQENSLIKPSEEVKDDNLLLYGISFFKQIPVTEAMKQKNPELTRSHLQKAVCILSRAPIFGHILAKLDPVTKCYFRQDDFEDTLILKNVYDNINTSLKDLTINSNELLAGVCVKKLIFFLKEKAMILWKAMFLEKKILIYSQNPSACSTFIHSLLALFPCLCHFKYQNKALNLIENHFNEYGLPLRLFHDKCMLIPYFSVQHLDEVIPLQGFLAGTSNPLIKTLPKVNWDILVDIDNNNIQFKQDSFKKLLALNKEEKEFIKDIIQEVKSNGTQENLSWKNMEESIFNSVDMNYEGSDDWIRQQFYDYLKYFLSELELFRHTCSEENLGPLIEEYNSELAAKAKMGVAPSPLLKQDDQVKEKIENAPRKGSQGDDTEIGTKAKNSNDEETKDSIQESPNVTDQQKEELKEETPRSAKLSGVKIQDPKVALKQEFNYLKETIKALKAFNIDWILEWVKTSNFRYWLSGHEKIVGERSMNCQSATNHIWLYDNGDIYFGQLKLGRRHGRGQNVYRSQNLIYRGDWKQDMITGEGTLSSLGNSDFLYDGNFKDNKKEGYGRLIKGKERYTGTFKNNRYEGNGVFVDQEQNVYEGEFKAGQKSGMGKLQKANGDMYSGEFLKGLPHGKIQIIYKNGDFYSGDYVEGNKSGLGVHQMSSGDLYEGEFSNDLYWGHGVMKHKDNSILEGEFENGKFVEGSEGIIIYSDGSKFKGTISNGKANGNGVLTKIVPGGIDIKTGRFEDDQLVEEYKEPKKEEPNEQVIEEVVQDVQNIPEETSEKEDEKSIDLL